MAAPKRNDLQIINDRVKIAAMILQGDSQDEIAKALSTSERTTTQQMVSYDLKAIKKDWADRYTITLENLNQARGEQMAKLEYLYKQNVLGWNRSKDEKKFSQSKKEKTKSGEKESAAVERVSQIGDQSFLAGAREIVKEENKLLGLYPPERHELTGANGGPIETTSARESLISKLNTAATRQKTGSAAQKHK